MPEPTDDDDASSSSPQKKLDDLRSHMTQRDLDAYLVFSEDAHHSEYVCERDERRAYLTGFTGSAGVALVTTSSAYLWTDSRYFLQAAKELSEDLWTLMKMYEPDVPNVEDYLYSSLKGKRIGYDPYAFTVSKMSHWKETWKKKSGGGGEEGDDATTPILVPVTPDLVDLIWDPVVRPPAPQNPLTVRSLEYAGETVSSKLSRVRDAIQKKHKAIGMVLSSLDQIAWLFNLRGSDIKCNPVFFSYAIVSQTSALLCVGRRDDGLAWMNDDVLGYLKECEVEVRPYATFGKEAIESMFPDGGRVLIEKSTCSVAVANFVSDAKDVILVGSDGPSPVEAFKSIKNDAERRGIRECSVRDSVALVRFIAWLTERMGSDEEDRDDVRETALSDKLLSYRRQQSLFVEESFDAISAVGSNSAVIHYKPVSRSPDERTLTSDDVYLLDSGGQYLDGTTDVTRTFHFGSPTPEQRRIYTRVLQGHINLASAVFPPGVPGLVLDAYARGPLWSDALSYGHGTGHGIGSYSNVHEGPMGIGGANQPGNVVRDNPRMRGVYLEPIKEGMYLSNEPGCYVDGKYGFRVESDVIVVPRDAGDDGDDENDGKKKKAKYLKFETVTKVPLCRSLIDKSLLTEKEIEWVDSYHAECRSTLMPLLADDPKAAAWLERETMSL